MGVTFGWRIGTLFLSFSEDCISVLGFLVNLSLSAWDQALYDTLCK